VITYDQTALRTSYAVNGMPAHEVVANANDLRPKLSPFPGRSAAHSGKDLPQNLFPLPDLEVTFYITMRPLAWRECGRDMVAARRSTPAAFP
jgi:hypothetical protein